MFQSQITQKQKESLSNFHYVFKRTLSYAGPTVTARKRRLFVAGIIALSGVVLHHSSQHGSRVMIHASQQTSHLAETPSGSHDHNDANLLVGGFGTLLLFFLKRSGINPFTKDYSNYIYITAQDIRGSP